MNGFVLGMLLDACVQMEPVLKYVFELELETNISVARDALI